MTASADTSASAAPGRTSARDRIADCDRMLAVFAEQIAKAQGELAALPLRDPARKRKRAQIADMEGDRADIQAERARLVPEAEVERRAELHAMKVMRWREAVANLPGFLDEGAAIDVATAKLLGMIAAYVRRADALVSHAGITVQPHHLVQPTITVERLSDIIAAKLVLLRGGAMDELPADFLCELQPALAAQAATTRGEARRVAEVILANDPDALLADRQRVELLNAERMRREAEAAQQPVKRLPAPPPLVHTVPPAVIGR